MWLFTRYGFYSVVCASGKSGETLADTVMIRARQKRHLRNLVTRFPELAALAIVETPQTDYRYRIIAPKALWVRVAAGLADELTWGNFKSEAHRHVGKSNAEYVKALNDVWEVMLAMQLRESL